MIGFLQTRLPLPYHGSARGLPGRRSGLQIRIAILVSVSDQQCAQSQLLVDPSLRGWRSELHHQTSPTTSPAYSAFPKSLPVPKSMEAAARCLKVYSIFTNALVISHNAMDWSIVIDGAEVLPCPANGWEFRDL